MRERALSFGGACDGGGLAVSARVRGGVALLLHWGMGRGAVRDVDDGWVENCTNSEVSGCSREGEA